MSKSLIKFLYVSAFLLVIGVVSFLVYKRSSINLYKQVDSYARSEFDLIKLPNELKDQQEKNLYTNKCSYDHKVSSLRCGTRYVKYFVSVDDPYVEYEKIDKYLANLGWINKYEQNQGEENEARLKKEGYLPSVLYRKGDKYDLELFISFLDERHSNDDPKRESDKKTNALLAKYYEEDQSLYKISITTGFVN